MKWVLDNLQIILVVAGTIAYWLNQRRRDKAGEEADYDGDGIPDNQSPRRKIDPNQPDPEEEARARKIQEEIRRKIAERRGESLPQPPRLPDTVSPPVVPVGRKVPVPGPIEAPRPTYSNPLEEMLRKLADPQEEVARARAAAAERAARERQLQLEEQMRELEQMQRAEREKAAALRRSVRTQTESKKSYSGSAQRELVQDLRGARNLRRAVVLREVLGPPPGLR